MSKAQRSYQTKICETIGCGAKKNLTRDHIVPRWITKSANELGIKIDHHRNSQCLCMGCNEVKGGNIAVDHEYGLEFWLELRSRIEAEIEKVYGITGDTTPNFRDEDDF